MKEFWRVLLVGLGTLCVVLGVLGMFLPLLPTTPFLLLAAFFYARSSDRFYNWLLTNRWCGEYIRNYREGRGIPLKQKLLTIAVLWITMSIGVLLTRPGVLLMILMFGTASGVTIHLLRLPTLKKGRTDAPQNAAEGSEAN